MALGPSSVPKYQSMVFVKRMENAARACPGLSWSPQAVLHQLWSKQDMRSHMLSSWHPFLRWWATCFLHFPFFQCLLSSYTFQCLLDLLLLLLHWITNFSQLGFYTFRMFVMRAFSMDSQLVHCIGFPSWCGLFQSCLILWILVFASWMAEWRHSTLLFMEEFWHDEMCSPTWMHFSSMELVRDLAMNHVFLKQVLHSMHKMAVSVQALVKDISFMDTLCKCIGVIGAAHRRP